MSNDEITGIYELCDAIEEIIQAADPKKRQLLDRTMQAYHECFPDEFHWAVSAQAPTMLFQLMTTIGWACATDEKPKKQTGRGVIRLVDRKPEGTA